MGKGSLQHIGGKKKGGRKLTIKDLFLNLKRGGLMNYENHRGRLGGFRRKEVKH